MKQNMEHQKDRKGKEDALRVQECLNIVMNRNTLELTKHIMIFMKNLRWPDSAVIHIKINPEHFGLL